MVTGYGGIEREETRLRAKPAFLGIGPKHPRFALFLDALSETDDPAAIMVWIATVVMVPEKSKS